MASKVSLASLASLALTSCGDGLLDDGYRGEPLFSFAGKVASDGTRPVYTAPLRTSIFWLPYDPTTLDEAFAERTPIDGFERIPGLAADAALVEQRSISTAVRFPGDFEVNVFAAPPAAARPGDAPLRYAVVLLYEDRDGDRALDDGERVGGAVSTLVVYAERALAADDPHNPLGHAVEPGYHAVELPLRCRAEAPVYPLDPTYAVRIGAACTEATAADDCGAGGTCLLADFDGPLPGGYCVLDIDAVPAGERPENAAKIETERDGVELEAWYRRCDASVECREGYTCQQHVCLPASAPALVLDPAAEIEASCAAWHEVERRERGG